MLYNNGSLFKRILFNQLILIIAVVCIVMSVICYLTCASYRQNEIAALQGQVNDYVYQIKSDLDKGIEKSEYIVKSPEMISLLNTIETDPFTLFNVSNRLSSYLDVINNDTKETISLYTTNPNLFQSRYIYQLPSLPNSSEVYTAFEIQNNSIVWADELMTDENGAPYFTYYRKMLLNNNSILQIKVFLPAAPDQIQCVRVTSENTEYANAKQYITVPIKLSYSAAVPVPTKELWPGYLKYVLSYLLAALMISLLLIYVATKINAKTTQSINAFLMELESNNLMNQDYLVPDSSDATELKTLKTTIRSLIGTIQEKNNEQYQVELEKRRLSMELLQSKIDPHILYNSLSVISLKAYDSGDQETIDIIDDLVSYYRLVLAKGKDIATLAEEVELLKKYVRINEISHAKTYGFHVDIPDSLLQIHIIHLLLQPLVENAVIHGLAGSRENCHIWMTAKRQDSFIVITIRDNGYGMPPEQVGRLNRCLEDGSSYGIKNTMERIKTFYGEECGLYFESTLGLETVVTIRITDTITSLM